MRKIRRSVSRRPMRALRQEQRPEVAPVRGQLAST